MSSKNALTGVRILYIGDWVFYTGPNFIESPFEMMAKDCQLHFLGKPVTDSLEQIGAEVKAFSNWQLYHFSSDQWQQHLDWADVVILSDVEARCFHLHPSFFDRSKYQKEILTFPDRLKLLAESVENGKGLLYLGGWLSFSGHMEKGGWRRCPIADWLPFECLVGEDLVESSEGFGVQTDSPDHPIIKNLPLETFGPILGYNEFKARDHFDTILTVKETGHPLLGVSEHGRGKMVTYASDPVAHWGVNLMLWEGYNAFWQNMVRWVLDR